MFCSLISKFRVKFYNLKDVILSDRVVVTGEKWYGFLDLAAKTEGNNLEDVDVDVGLYQNIINKI